MKKYYIDHLKNKLVPKEKPKEDIKATLKDLPFAMARAEANKLMSYTYNPTTGTFMNANGDETKDAKSALKHNKELDDALGSQNQVSETKAKIQKKIFPKKNFKKPLSDIDLFYAVADPAEKAQMRREYKDYNFVLKKHKTPEPVVTPTKAFIDYRLPTPPLPATEEKVVQVETKKELPKDFKWGIGNAYLGDIVYERRLQNNSLPQKERTVEKEGIITLGGRKR